MSKPLKPILCLSIVFAQILQLLNITGAQTTEIRVSLDGSAARIDGKLAGGESGFRNFALADSSAGLFGLAARHSKIELNGPNGDPMKYRVLAPGELLADSDFYAFKYRTELSPLSEAAMGHASWFAGGRGLLMGSDLLPRFDRQLPTVVTFDLPAGMKIVSSEKDRGVSTFIIENQENAIFLVGDGFRSRELPGRTGQVVLDGEFRFSDDEASRMTDEILGSYRDVFGSGPEGRVTALIVRYPQGTRFGRWEAETRGSTALIVTADMPFSTQSVQKLHEQLRHELFHLWIPNGVALSGNYDWFYEGFALYQSLRTAVALNRIRFEDFLDTLARAHDADASLRSRKSLIDASRDRWNGANTQVYARGMLVAFLIDIALLSNSKGKDSVARIFQEIYTEHRLGKQPEDGNTAILRRFESDPTIREITEKYIRGAEMLEWQTPLAAIGIESRTDLSGTKLTVKTKPSGRQKDLLNKLGYNSWRNLLKSKK